MIGSCKKKKKKKKRKNETYVGTLPCIKNKSSEYFVYIYIYIYICVYKSSILGIEHHLIILTQLAGAEEYTDCISAEG